jgi:hypothetical protein
MKCEIGFPLCLQKNTLKQGLRIDGDLGNFIKKQIKNSSILVKKSNYTPKKSHSNLKKSI